MITLHTMRSTSRRLSRRSFLKVSGVAALAGGWRQIMSAAVAKSVETGVLNVGYQESGNFLGFLIMLLHGFPDDIYAWDDVTLPLVKAGYRVFVPYLRGFGFMRFRDS